MSEGPKKLTVYLSGPITGRANGNREAFDAAEARLRAAGYETLNPATLHGDEQLDWSEYMRRDIRAMMDCQLVALLPGWEESPGACIEWELARRVGIRVARVETLVGQ